MADPVRQAAVLGDPYQPYTRQNLEVVRVGENEMVKSLETAGRRRTEEEPMSATSIINQAVESVITLINAMSLFSSISRGALGTGNGLACEVGPTSPESVWLDKNQFIPIDLTINGKNDDLLTLSDAMNFIHEALTMKTSYPYGDTWEITDIQTMTEPQIVSREDSNQWVMASALTVKVATHTTEPAPPAPSAPVAEETQGGQE